MGTLAEEKCDLFWLKGSSDTVAYPMRDIRRGCDGLLVRC
jgi:hypothetical protein